MTFDLRVMNANIVSSSSVTEGDLYVKDGKIAAIAAPGSAFPARETVDAAGRHLLPGVVDPHVHAGYGMPEDETFAHAGRAAAAGGITTIIEQPLSDPITVTAKAFLEKKAAGEREFCVDFGLFGGLVPGALDEMEKIHTLGGGAYKTFMCRSSCYPMTDDGTLIEGLKRLRSFGGLNCVHAENDALMYEIFDRLEADGLRGPQAFIDYHPPYSELEAVLRYLFLLRQVPGAKGHIAHCSLPDGVRAVHRAQADGLDVTVETCPQYLMLCEDDLFTKGGVAKCDPPPRSAALREELWRCVLAGQADMIVSDHSPHPFDKKVVPMDRFTTASEGVTGLETMLPVVLSEGVIRRGLPLTAVARMMSENPARRFGLFGRKGALEVGFDADFNIVDLSEAWQCRAENMHYLNRHTPYDGVTFKGRIDETWLRGTLICKDRKVLAEPGSGRFLRMELSK